MSVWLAVYLAGFVWGLLRADARPLSRLLLALLWPIGPAAFALVLVILVAVSPIAFPVFGTLLLGTIGAAWWVLT